MKKCFLILIVACCVPGVPFSHGQDGSRAIAQADSLPAGISDFISGHCVDCHNDVEKEGGLDLGTLAKQSMTPEFLPTWIKAHDHARSGEMPPEEVERPEKGQLDTFLQLVSKEIVKSEEQALAGRGRSVKRRLNRYEYENTLRDLLSLPYLEIKETLPEDPTSHGYNKIGEALDVSHVQLARYLRTADAALREAVVPVLERPDPSPKRYYTWQQPGFRKSAGPAIRKTHPVVGLELQPELVGKIVKGKRFRPNVGEFSKPERRDEEAVVLVASSYEPIDLQFNQFRAPVSGPYRLRFSGYTVWMSRDFKRVTRGRRTEPITIYSDTTPRILRRMGAFDFGPDPSVHEMEVWLKAGETIRPDATRLVRPRPTEFKNPLAEADGMPGVAFQWMEVEGPLYETWPPAGHKLLFGDLDLAMIEKEKSASDFDPKNIYDPNDPAQDIAELLMNDIFANRGEVVVQSRQPTQDAERLLDNFIQKAYRHPVSKADRERFLGLILESLAKGHSFKDSMIAGYTAVLVSPEYLYHQAFEGSLDGYALAERLAYFLWNSSPDEELLQLAETGDILDPSILNQQVERLLDDPKSRRFVNAFLDYWLDLRRMGESSPDVELYPEYQLDDALVESMPEETQLYFQQLIKDNLGVRHLVDSDFVVINERLATHY